MTQVALWYWRHYQIDYDLFDSEEEAASVGVYMQDDGGCSVAGAQFADGRIIAVGQWPAWASAWERLLQAERQMQERRISALPRPARKVKAPFSGQVIEVDASEPAWIGEAAEANASQVPGQGRGTL